MQTREYFSRRVDHVGALATTCLCPCHATDEGEKDSLSASLTQVGLRHKSPRLHHSASTVISVQIPLILRIIQQLMGRVLLKVTNPTGSPGAPASLAHSDPPRLLFSATAGAQLLLLVFSGSTPAAVDADTDILTASTLAASARRR